MNKLGRGWRQLVIQCALVGVGVCTSYLSWEFHKKVVCEVYGVLRRDTCRELYCKK